MLPIIHEVFGDKANRCKLSWDQINNDLLPKVKTAIQAKFNDKELPALDFDVVLTPAMASNIQTTLNHRANSQTTIHEWSSTPLLKQDNTDSGYRLVVGDSDVGGAGYVAYDRRWRSWNPRPHPYGFRLSVVFKKS